VTVPQGSAQNWDRIFCIRVSIGPSAVDALMRTTTSPFRATSVVTAMPPGAVRTDVYASSPNPLTSVVCWPLPLRVALSPAKLEASWPVWKRMMTVFEAVPPEYVHTVVGGLLASIWRPPRAVPKAALTSATVTMAQVTFDVGWAEVGADVGRAAGDVAVAVVGVREPFWERGAFLAQAQSATETTIRTTAQRLADMGMTSLEPGLGAQRSWTRSVNALSNSMASAVVPYWAASKMGAASSLLHAMISSDSLIPSRCSGAPEMPNDR
jgi:hypothetical protein